MTTASTTRTAFFVDGMAISLALFSASAMYFVKRMMTTVHPSDLVPFHQRRRKSLQDLLLQEQQSSLVTNDAEHPATKRSISNAMLSKRGQASLIPVIPIQQQFLACIREPYDPMHNPTGYIALCVAENKLVTSILVDRCMQSGTASAALADPQVYCYNSFLGMPVAREAAAYFLARWFLHPTVGSTFAPTESLQHIHPSHIALAAGAAAILSNLFFVLGDPGDACLIPAPYYAAFENDMNLVANVVPFAIHQANPMQGPTESELSLAYMQCKAAGLNPRFVLLTNPNNPLAVIYRPPVILRCVQWARKRKMHTIVDEIYALSTHQKEGHAFQSIIRILNNELGPDVHMVWAASKDFGCSGLRYGVLYSQNEVLMEALNAVSTFSCVSGPIQYLISELMTDDVFVGNFLDESRDRLVQSYNVCTRKLDEMVLPFIPAEAGMFVYVDFSSLLPSKTFEWEQKLSELLFRARVVLTPGEGQRDAAPGMFRICYAWVSPDALEVAMERLSRLVAKLRRMEWMDINGRAIDSILYG